MSIDEFIAGSQAALLAFRAATIAAAQTDETFYPNRDEVDWWREVAAYFEYTELEEKFRRGGQN